MSNLILKLIILWTVFFFAYNIACAQVTIGSNKTPVAGALLQLKEFDTTDALSNGQTTATKGLVMPRVKLEAIDGDLGLSMGLASRSLNQNEHVGLTIYNVVSDLCSTIIPGVYTWDGTSWLYMGGSGRIDHTSFNPVTEILTDYEGNQYTTKVFGTKRWMTQNLRSIRKSDGGCIDGVDGLRFSPAKNNTVMPVAQITVKSSVPVGNVSYTQNGVVMNVTNEAYISTYGLVYTFAQANTACPSGWHLSTTQDWADLTTALDGATNLGAKLRANTGVSYKAVDNTSTLVWGAGDPAVAISGFNALPAGWVREDGVTAVGFPSGIYLWTSTSGNYRYLSSSTPGLSGFGGGNLLFHFTVRCVQD